MIFGLIRRAVRERRGAILAEFALTFPILVLLILGGVEVGRFVLLEQKLHAAAVTMADLTAQAEELSTGELDNLFAAVDHITTPFALAEDGLVIVSSVSASGGNPPTVDWQRTGAGTATKASAIGAPGEEAELPEGFVVRDGESVIVAEVFFDYAPLFGGQYVDAREIYKRSLYRPRFGALTSLN